MSQIEEAKNQNELNTWAYVIPFVANMLLTLKFAPKLGAESVDDVAVENYLYLIIAQVVLALLTTGFFWRTYLREFPLKVDHWGAVTGVVGFFLWIGICALQIEAQLLSVVGLESWIPERLGFNPFDQISDDNRRGLFLIFRFVLLAAMIPLIEELLIRGWLVRFYDDVKSDDGGAVQLSTVGMAGIKVVAVYAVLTHPGEAIAAVVWFSLVSMLMIKTGKFWNCVLAHAVTNLMLGIYIVFWEQWHLW